MNPSLKLVRSGLALIGCLCLSMIELWAAPPKMVKDLAEGIDTSGSSNPANFIKVEDAFYFSAKDSMHGIELWKSDGTEAGTTLLKDIWSGSNDASPANFVAIGNILYFSASTEAAGNELWRSDGTEAGTYLVKDIRVGNSSTPASLTAVNGTLYFTANDGINGKELWKSDGTSGGTVMVKDIAVGSATSSPFALTAMDGALYFTASDGVNGMELWKSDGSEAGTVLLKDIYIGASSSNPSSFRAIGTNLFFAATNGTNGIELWKTDGTTSGTSMLKNICSSGSSTPSGLIEFSGNLYFAATDGVNGVELWTSDGTEAGTLLVKDIREGSASSSPSQFTIAGTSLYFCSTTDRPSGSLTVINLWKTDGTEEGTVLVKDINAGSPISSSPTYLTSHGNILYFVGSMQISGKQLWKTDGTLEGTVQLSSSLHASPMNIFSFEDNIYFTSNISGTFGRELWKSDGSIAGTILLKDIFHTGLSYEYSDLTCVEDTLFLDVGNMLWRTDGTLERTVQAPHLPAFSYSDPLYNDPFIGQSIENMKYLEGLKCFYFLQGDAEGSTGLWKSDGSAAGTVLVRNLQTDPIPAFAEAGPRVFFTTYTQDLITPDSGKLWVSMGTPETTQIILGTAEGEIEGSQPHPSDLTAVGNIVYFFANEPEFGSGRSLWKSDGSAAGTVVVKNFGGPGRSWETNMIAASGGVYFWLDTSTNGRELWWSDGTTEGTQPLLGVTTGSNHFEPDEMIIFQNQLFFSLDDGVNGRELWNASGMLKDIYSGAGDGSPAGFTIMNGLLYFSANDGVNGRELWRTDGTEAGTFRVTDIGNVSNAKCAMGGLLYFSGDDGIHGSELWQSDGTSEGTVIVADIANGSAESFPSNFQVVGSQLYFTAVTEQHGRELYFYNPSDTDGDWIPDDWEISYGLNLSDELDALLDTDGDGQSNLAEYYAGTNPLLSSSYFATTITSPISGGFQIEFTGLEDKKYSVLFKDDLTSPDWQVLHQIQRPSEVPFGPYPITIQDTPPPGVTGRFYKVVTPAVPD